MKKRSTILILVMVFIITGTGISHARNYDSQMGRFISRDPIGYSDGVNLYQYVSSQPIILNDPTGMWGKDVHYGKTREWAYDSGMVFWAAVEVARADQGIDENYSTSPLPGGQLGRHMDVGGNSQMMYWVLGYAKAVVLIEKADKSGGWDMCKKAAQEFGKGLHSLQDTSAHRGHPDGIPWPTFRVHPGWWDYYGPLPHPEYINLMHHWDNEVDWEEEAAGTWKEGGVYDIWKNTSTQVESQQEAMRKVESDTKKQVSDILQIARTSCICKKYFGVD